MWNSGRIEEGSEQIGTRVSVRVVKNKVAPPFREATFDIIYGKGILRSRDLVNTGEASGVVSRSGSWYAFGDQRLGQGVGNSARALEESPELAGQLEAAIREASGLSDSPATTADATTEANEGQG